MVAVGNVISDPVLLDRYIVVADYKKQSSNQCNLREGDIVEVVEKNQHGKGEGPVSSGCG